MKILRFASTAFQWCLDIFHSLRSFVVTILAYLTLRAYGFEIAYGDVKSGKYASRKYSPLNLDGAQDLDSLLKMAEESFRQSLLASQGGLGVFFSNGLLSSIMILGLIALFWSAIQEGYTRLLRPKAA